MNWPGLLKWTMKNTDGSKLVDKDLKPINEEDAKWLEEALESFHFNEMKEIMKILDKLKEPELGTDQDCEDRSFLIEDLLVLIDGLENNRNIVRAKRLEQLIHYFFTTKYKKIQYLIANVLTSMMQNDKYVQDAAVNLNLFDILNLINETPDDTLLAKCIYLLSGLIYGDNLNTKLLFIEKYDGISLIYNLLIKQKDKPLVMKRILNILRELTKIEENDSELNQIRLKSLLKIMDIQLNELIVNIIKNSCINDENKEFYENEFEKRVISYEILVNICKSFSSTKEIFNSLTSFNEMITKSELSEENKRQEKTYLIEIIKRIKSEFNRKEEIKQKDSNITQLDNKAVLLNLKKEDDKEDKDQSSSNNQMETKIASNIPMTQSITLHTDGPNGTILLPSSLCQEK